MSEVRLSSLGNDAALVSSDGWVKRTLRRIEEVYRGTDGLLVTEVDGRTGAIKDATPLVSDFGDVLPFVVRAGNRAFAMEQIAAADVHLNEGLFQDVDGRVLLFNNHDWLLGLLELHHLTGDPTLLRRVVDGAHTVISRFMKDGLLLDEVPAFSASLSAKHLLRVVAQRSSPFNVGFVELFLEIYAKTQDPQFLNAARTVVFAYLNCAPFDTDGVFGRIFTARSSVLNRLLRRAARQRSLLFKDNTNAIWSLLALRKLDDDQRIKAAIDRWISAFEQKFWNDGNVFLWLSRDDVGHEVSLKAAFSSIDLLCDLYISGFSSRTLELAIRTAERWLQHQWSNGLFPEVPDGVHDHLDCNTDMTVSLMKLAAITGRSEFATAARRCAESTLTLHEIDFGFAQAVNKHDVIVSDRVIVKYQGLALKLSMLPRDPSALLNNDELLYLLRDR